ncbi:MAG: hypothetical protein IT561_06320, partial [Alphaproteobacteria bacterium]|nr:hypothetical protein [Alphaproteobacteria bacterium]
MLASFLRRNPAPAKAPVDRGRIDAQILKALDKTLDGQKTAAALIGRLKRDCDALRCEIDVLRREIARRDAGP